MCVWFTAKSFQTCAHFGFPLVNYSSCGDHQGVLGCPYNVTFPQAEAFCRGEGARLCTLNEINNGFVESLELSGGPCQFNRERVWTLTECNQGSGFYSRSGGMLAKKLHTHVFICTRAKCLTNACFLSKCHVIAYGYP